MSKEGFALLSFFIKWIEYLPSIFDIRFFKVFLLIRQAALWPACDELSRIEPVLAGNYSNPKIG
jgi:hypothetical protein